MSRNNGNVIKKHYKNRNFTIIDNDVFMNKELSLKAKGLLSLLLSLPDGWSFSERGLTALSTDGRDSLRSGLHELESSGYLVREQVRGNDGRFQTVYNIHEKPWLEKPSRKNRVGKTESDNPTAYKVSNNKVLSNKVSNNKSNRINNRNTNKNKYDETPFFNDFWELYPNKQGKAAALRYFKRKVKDKETFDLIVKDLERRKKYSQWVKEDGKFVPHPSTYINQERWLDEYETDLEPEIKLNIPVY